MSGWTDSSHCFLFSCYFHFLWTLWRSLVSPGDGNVKDFSHRVHESFLSLLAPQRFTLSQLAVTSWSLLMVDDQSGSSSNRNGVKLLSLQFFYRLLRTKYLFSGNVWWGYLDLSDLWAAVKRPSIQICTTLTSSLRLLSPAPRLQTSCSREKPDTDLRSGVSVVLFTEKWWGGVLLWCFSLCVSCAGRECLWADVNRVQMR